MLAQSSTTRGAASVWAAMLGAVLFVALIAYWDARREASAALADFAGAQVALATGLADPVATRLAAADPETPPAALLTGLRRVEKPGRLTILFARSGREGLLRTDGSRVRSPVIEDASARGAAWVRLSHEEAEALGLPARTAIAGLAPIEDGPTPQWTVAVVATAQEERDRELRAQWRLILGVTVAASLVFAFGGLALRKQRKELELARELAVAEVQHERDERFVRADKLATMGALATGIAHEVSTPLGVMMGRAEQVLPKVADDERARRAVEAILEQGERIGRVVRGFLALARGESPSFDHVDPAQIARNSVELVEHRFEKAGVKLQRDVARILPLVACEPRLLEQSLANLLLNACDACQEGGLVTLDVRGDSERVAFVVTDDGEGITAESAARVFEPFFTTKPPGSGTGLGLAISNEIIKHHRGTLTVEPRPRARGTRACIELPAVQRNHEQAAALLH
jgi:two-component system NtrC family sensor kinase